MKATIRRADGTTIETEGTPEEIAKLAGVPATQYVFVDRYMTCPHPHYPPAWMPLYPQQPFDRPFWVGAGPAGACAGNAQAGTFLLTVGGPNA